LARGVPVAALPKILNISRLKAGPGNGLRVGYGQGKSQPEEAWDRLPNRGESVLGPYVIEFDDIGSTGELRFNAIGLVDGRMLFVIYVVRDDVVRIISVRGAEPHEKRKYHDF
jgi:hypothetical protein